jgi:hypothetical protein
MGVRGKGRRFFAPLGTVVIVRRELMRRVLDYDSGKTMGRCSIIFVAVWLTSFVAHAQQLPCTEAENRRVEDEAVKLRSWDALYRSYKLYGRCNNVIADEGYSESVARTLVEHWATLPRLAKLAENDAGFRRFVLGHVDATLDMKDVGQIRAKAKDACPPNLRPLCADLQKQADAALDEGSYYRQEK